MTAATIETDVRTGQDAPAPKRRRGRPMLRDKWAEQVFMHIPVGDDQGLTAAELAEVTGLSPQQVSAAVAYLRDHYPELPLVSGKTGYRFSLDAADVEAFRRWRVRSAQTTIRRAWTGVVKPYLDRAGSALETRIIARQFERLLEDLEELTA